MTIALIAHAVALLVYVAASVFYGATLALRTTRNTTLARALFLTAIAVHVGAIGFLCVQTRQSPFATTFGTLSIAAWAVAILYLPVEFLVKVPALGALAAPVDCLLLFAAILRGSAGGSPAQVQIVRSQIVNIHVMLVLVSFALFALAACCAAFYVWQYGALKRPNRKALFRKLPPLETADSAAYHLVAFALPLLTLGIVLGIVRAIHEARALWLTDPHTLISLFVWLVYGGYLAARIAAGWRGTRLNYMLIAGLAVTVLLFFVPSHTHRFS